jgi:cytochrome c551/c552
MKILVGYISVIIIAVLSIYAFEVAPIPVPGNNSNASYFPKDSTKSQKQVDNGIGPISELKLGPIDKKLADDGQDIFNSKCIACHQLDNKLIGPPLRNITKNNSPVFLMNYLLNTTEMQKKDKSVIKLIKEYNNVVMPNQNLTKKQARALLEYLRQAATED